MGEIRVGKPDIQPDSTAHIRRVHQGNAGRHDSAPGHHGDGTADARRSTGIQPEKHNAILPIMPNLPPG
ncbi:hypothetical protein CRI77_06595 [Mycolicibacterium duvalii]|uniref:Uncharacterized protein n=1 Tax=Mycolicibacterium duvalii TaxID=39688 RepID=A0A7I7K6N7_9MYCO|nr:hypothetical protein [Mycolicibacterium duvalii]MCV7368105.1 hypothetical protein [Mycolicibacterium duvalii]PEG43401.1 hypothetical protein CRI77_06595 [Mycolicibacterium duvalii]BBX19755.1 hypothetical protein MDUV_46150 [Mycolicibacterium duvalii]